MGITRFKPRMFAPFSGPDSDGNGGNSCYQARAPGGPGGPRRGPKWDPSEAQEVAWEWTQEVAGEGAQEGRGSCMEGSYSATGGPRKGYRRAGEGAVSALEKEGRKKIGINEWGPQRKP
jgi:hypothetical protein